MSSSDDANRFTPADVAGVLANPIYAIDIDPRLATPHPPLVDEEVWIQANVKMVRDLGVENYLRNLLSILKGNWVAGDDASDDGEMDEGGDDVIFDSAVHANIDADVVDRFVADAICDRLATESGILPLSVSALHADNTLDEKLLRDLRDLEAAPDVLVEVLAATPDNWPELSFEAQRLLLIYLIEQVLIGSPDLPLPQQITIVWRVPVRGTVE